MERSRGNLHFKWDIILTEQFLVRGGGYFIKGEPESLKNNQKLNKKFSLF